MASAFIENQFQFAEMNIQHKGNADKTLALVRRAVRMGYDCVVINTDIGDINQSIEDVLQESSNEEPPKKKKKKGKRENIIPDPVQIDVSKVNTADLEVAGKKFRLYSRLTVTLSDSTSVYMLMHHPQAHKYDLIAVRPGDDRILQTLSRKGDFIDIITYDQTATSIRWLYSKSGLIQTCISEGLSFEITYAEALKDSSQRRQVLTNARQLLLITRGGRGVILASGAEEIIDLRAPYDAANLSILFGGRPEDSRKFVAGNAKKALLRAESRKTLKGAMVVTSAEDIPSHLVNRKSELERLMSVPEFRAQLEVVEGPSKDSEEPSKDVDK